MTEITEIKEQAWARLLRSQRVLLERVEQALKNADMPPLVWYDVMLELDREESGMRQFELSERMLLNKHNLSRLLDRLEKQSLLQRINCADDGRGIVVHITSEGRKLRRAMWPVYAAAITENFASRLSASEAREFSNTLKKLLD